ncbi:MAG: sulfurtransferase [Gemmatimonadales bacterium]|jgi:thiosulfate/3-mercaptopyruvate sulfurtransferase|nr:sulfurtransferase [Gemmatimonadales bacterium]MBT4912036.1 sulfurtransferase [Gemmatimonadales bacterium]MBT6375392.1 sulfurtransferase [Gemmatimonadales bacterium]MBT7126455.1 sulfurtransferase [Gemmatimonadales bacterium]
MGIGPSTDVVIYDDWGTLFAIRLWWVLAYYGFDRVRVLDGGWQAWVSAGLPVSYEVPDVREVEDLDIEVDPRRIIGRAELQRRHADEDLQVLDVRSEDAFNGVVFRGNKRKGRILGATHLEWNRRLENSTDAQAVRVLRSENEVDTLITGAPLDLALEVVAHCQAAVRATHTAFVLEVMGYPLVRVYDGSMEEWANRTDTPLE